MLRSIAKKRTHANTPMVTAHLDIDDAIGISFRHKTKQFYTRCKIIAHIGGQTAILESHYFWNGADIPIRAVSILGISREDKKVILASGFHDKETENGVAQVLADAMFVTLLAPIRFNGFRLDGVGRVRATAMYLAVRFYSIFCRPIAKVLRVIL